ncbi:sporulation protein Cse60 [Macrococcus bovicus]|uniref:sporulation protein Cse60 n=1 Tax=Macrococcus bovicus TaxID=69968 RepID=UPI003365448E
MLQVQIFEESSRLKLQDVINKWLSKTKLDVVDIKYSSRYANGAFSSEKYSAMIIYRS